MKRRSRAGGEPVKTPHRKTAARKRGNAPKVAVRRSPPAGQETEIARLTRERDEALEQRTATAEVLKIISTSPTELQPVLEVVVRSAARFCEADDVTIFELDGQDLRMAAHWGTVPVEIGLRFPCTRGSVAGRIILGRRSVHVFDLQAEAEEFPEGSAMAKRQGHRTIAGVPLLREGVAIGTIQIRRAEVKPFTEKQIALLETFADQAVIAIENTRLLNELRQSLEQQTATSEVLRVISSSPGELEPVFVAMLANAVRICGADFGNIYRWSGDDLHLLATHNTPPAFAEARRNSPFRPGPDTPTGRMVANKTVTHVTDLAAEPRATEQDDREVRFGVDVGGIRTLLSVPMLKEDELVGAFTIYRQEVRPFTDKQIELVKNFAAQAVIAIENTRLLNELRQRTTDLTESLEQQTATSEVLKVISSSPGDLQSVFEAMLANATRLCEAKFGVLFRSEGDALRAVAMHGAPPAYVEERRRNPIIRPILTPQTTLGRAVATKQTVQIADVLEEPNYFDAPSGYTGTQLAKLTGARTILAVPMIKENELMGAIVIYRQEVRPFTNKQVELVTNFAAQAVIAIENTRLLSELRQSLERQTATADVLRVISSSPGELEPVFQAMLENATRICEATFGVLNLHEDGAIRMVAMHNVPIAFAEFLEGHRGGYQPMPGSLLDRAMRTKQVIHSADNAAEATSRATTLGGARSIVCVPMLKDDELIGTITIYRQEVRPFTDKQIELVQNFAAQAVIAIENTRLLNELRESLQQQTATSEVLGVISSSPGDLQPVFQAMLENAVRICEGRFGSLFRFGGAKIEFAAEVGTPPEYAEFQKRRGFVQPRPGTLLDRVARTKQVIHTADYAAEPFPGNAATLGGARSTLCVPMLKDDALVGAIFIYRQEVRPFTDKQIELLKNFAAQAVIAIENTRLLHELRQSLEQQTATANVLRVISSSPGDLEPVFQAMLENATRVCDAKFGTLIRFDGEYCHVAAQVGTPPEYAEYNRQRGPYKPTPGGLLDGVIRTKREHHTADATADVIPAASARLGGARTRLVVPMLKEDMLIGAISIYRQEVRPFNDKQIELVQNFAAQAVIAIENTRLLNELRQSLEQQTATAEVLSVISSSPGELEPVFQAMLENATRICEAAFGSMLLREGDSYRRVAVHNAPSSFEELHKNAPILRRGKAPSVDRVIDTRQVSHIFDVAKEDPNEPIAKFGGARTLLVVPMLKDDEAIGVFGIYRQEVRPFSDKQIALVQNFANQAVIAIENTRLLNELRESLEQQTATAEVLRAISSSPGELEPVFQSMLENATRICEAKFGSLYRFDGKAFHFAAEVGTPPELAEFQRRRGPFQPLPGSHLDRVMRTKQVSHAADIVAEAIPGPATMLGGARSYIAVPMLKDDELIGAITIYRQEVRPFTDKQVELVTNFAAQAVIAIENTRLLNELRQRTTDLAESLEQQTATSEVLKVIIQLARRLAVGVQRAAGKRRPHLRRQVRRPAALGGR